MGISVYELLTDELFSGTEVLAGREGLSRIVQSVSVFDCPYHEDILNSGIISSGDIFLSCLEQFQPGSESLVDFLNFLDSHGCAGLIVVPTGKLSVIDDRIKGLCEEKEFPVLLLGRSVPYSAIMKRINRYLSMGTSNTTNSLKLEQLKLGHLSQAEQQAMLRELIPGIADHVRTMYVQGDFYSKIAALDMQRNYLSLKEDLLVVGKQIVFLLSAAREKDLKNKSDAVCADLKNYFSSFHVGFSRIYPVDEAVRTLAEGEKALQTAVAMNISQQTYEPMRSLHLLLALHHSQEAKDFYHAYVEAIASHVSREGLPEMLRTVEAFVANAGDYGQTARQIGQHVNTVRYRLNRVKGALGMEEDQVRFYETIALAAKLRTLLQE